MIAANSKNNNEVFKNIVETLSHKTPYDIIFGDFDIEVLERVNLLNKYHSRNGWIMQKFSVIYLKKRENQSLSVRDRLMLFSLYEKILKSIMMEKDFRVLIDTYKRKTREWYPLCDHGYIEIYSSDEMYEYPKNKESLTVEINDYISMNLIYSRLSSNNIENFNVTRIKSAPSLLFEYTRC